MMARVTCIVLFGAGVWVGGYLKNACFQEFTPASEATRIPAPQSLPRRSVTEPSPESGNFEDTVSALVSAIQTEDYLSRRLAVAKLIRDVPPTRFPALIQSAMRVPLKFRKPLLVAVVEQWLAIDKASAVEWVRSRPHRSEYLEVVAQYAPHEALEMMTSPGARIDDWEGQKIALEKLAGTDLHNQIALMASLPVSNNRDGILFNLIQGLIPADPASAFQLAGETLAKSRAGTLQSILERWAESDPAAALAEAGPLLETAKVGAFGSEFASRLTRSIASKDPTLALQFALSLPEDLQRFPLIGAVSEWAKTDPSNALTWALEQGIELTQPKEPDSDQIEPILLTTFAERPDETAEWLLALPAGAQRQQLIRALLADAMFTATDARLNLAPGSPALRLFSDLAPDMQARLASSLGWELGQQKTLPGDADWKTRFPNEDVRGRIKAGALGAIWEKSSNRAEAMLASIPAGRERDWALKQVALHEAAVSPEQAAQHALQIASTEIQRAALDDVISDWLEHDAAACQEWLNAHPQFPPSWRADWVPETPSQ